MIKVRKMLKRLREDGWVLVSHDSSSHRQFAHPTKPGKVTVAGHPSDTLKPGTFLGILRAAQLPKE